MHIRPILSADASPHPPHSCFFSLRRVWRKRASVRLGVFHSRWWRGGVFKKICGWHHCACQWYKLRVGGVCDGGRGRRSIHTKQGPHCLLLAFCRPPLPPSPQTLETNQQTKQTKKKIATASRAVGFGSASRKSSLFSGCGTFGADVMSGPSRGQCVAVQGPEWERDGGRPRSRWGWGPGGVRGLPSSVIVTPCARLIQSGESHAEVGGGLEPLPGCGGRGCGFFFFLDVCMFPFIRLPSPPPGRLKMEHLCSFVLLNSPRFVTAAAQHHRVQLLGGWFMCSFPSPCMWGELGRHLVHCHPGVSPLGHISPPFRRDVAREGRSWVTGGFCRLRAKIWSSCGASTTFKFCCFLFLWEMQISSAALNNSCHNYTLGFSDEIIKYNTHTRTHSIHISMTYFVFESRGASWISFSILLKMISCILQN